MDSVVNSLNLAGWAYLLLRVGLQLFLDPAGYQTADIALDVIALQVVQLFQFTDILMIVLGKSKGSLLGAIAQILARNLVSLYFISRETTPLLFAMVTIIWATADINRYLYYLFKSSPLTGFLRYNSFLVLYPIGVFGEMLVINDYIKRNAETLTDIWIYLIRGIQTTIVLGMFFLYSYMLKGRKKYMRELEKKGQSEPAKEGEKEERRSASPRQAKRD
jgi:very-long-chain (3R)-3-hydroxyacyl-CoA dehydratase